MSARVLMVCSGNICRSPFAEGLLRAELARRSADSIAVSSAGTLRLTGRRASDPSIKVARDYAVDLADHRSRPLGLGTLRRHDVVLVMERDHRRLIQTQWPEEAARVQLLRAYDDQTEDGARRDIFDPIGLPEADYRRCFEIIARCVRSLAGTLGAEQ